ncbi:sorting nexin-24 [Carlito syrichta]|uniref:Sorting nexin-24 n=1 Tax=Carlito syrichta TaxID=1868482 RepID=A0A3Q0DHG0_CARSF|nr:sorting nexin-24 [Carlito syrichta]
MDSLYIFSKAKVNYAKLLVEYSKYRFHLDHLSDLMDPHISAFLVQWVFKIEVLMNGRKHFVEKRYSEFHALHKKLKKCIKTPEIPSKHVRNWVPKVLEQRRQGLETYLQAVILENEELPKLFLDFLNVRHLPSLPKAESCGSFDETESEESSKLSHQPVLLFLRDPYVLPAASDFPNVVIEGVLHGIFYPHLQPR